MGEDYDRDREDEEGTAGGGGSGLYSKEGLAALRHNAIHIGASSTSPPSSPASHPTPPLSAPLDDDTLPPDETAQQQRLIRHAKTQRARRRALAEAGEDYIPLSTATRPSHPSLDEDDVTIERVISRHPIVLDGASTSSRTFGSASEVAGDDHPTLLREDDTDDVVDVTNDLREVEGGDRILFGDDGRQQRREKRRQEIEATLSAPSAEPIDVDEEVDSELEEWEVEQLRKGGGQLTSQRPVDSVLLSHRTARADDHRIPNPSQPTISSLAYPNLHSSLRSHLSALRQVHAATLSHSTSLSARLTSLQATRASLQQTAEETEEAFVFYQEMSAWLQSLLAMLAEKVEDIDEAWEEMGRIRRRRGELKEERRRLLLEDEADEAAGTTETSGANERSQEVDEFGRDVEYVREGDRQRRRDIRTRVHHLIQAERVRREESARDPKEVDTRTTISALMADVDGWESEEDVVDEVEGTAASHAALLKSFHEDVRGLMADVDEQWRDLRQVLGRFQVWRSRYPKSYHDAFIDLSLHKVFAPYIRLDLMQIDLLPSLSAQLSPFGARRVMEQFGWYLPLMLYSQEAETGEAAGGLLPSLWISVVYPWLTVIVREEWDVRSERQGRTLRWALDQLTRLTSHSVGEAMLEGSPAWFELRSAVLDRLAKEVTEARRRQLRLSSSVGRGSEESLQRWCVRQVKLLHVLTIWSDEYSIIPLPSLTRLVRMQATSTIAAAMPMVERLEVLKLPVAMHNAPFQGGMLVHLSKMAKEHGDPVAVKHVQVICAMLALLHQEETLFKKDPRNYWRDADDPLIDLRSRVQRIHKRLEEMLIE